MGKPRNKFNTKNETPENQQRLASGGAKKFTIHDLIKFYPKTKAQSKAFDAYNNNSHILVQIGAAGTGKTAVAINCALREYFEKLHNGDRGIDKIVIIRTASASTDLGFMPGTEAEKESYYEEPYVNVIDEMFHFNKSYQNLKALEVIEFRTTANLRGLSFHNSIVIFDEFQSCDLHIMKTVVTRLGNNSKLLICGDLGQNDLRHKKGNQKTGFSEFMTILKRMATYGNYNIDIVEYTPDDVVRSGIARDFTIACYELDL